MAQLDLDDYEVPSEEPVNNFDNLPPGDYAMQVIESEAKDTRNGDGRVLALTWEVTEGEHTSRKVFQNINYKNPSAKAQEIGRRDLDAVTFATGITRLDDTDDLLWKPCLVRVKITPAKGEYQAKNEVVFVKRLAAPAAPAARPAATRPAAGAAAGRPAAGAAPSAAGARPAAGRPWPSAR